MLPACPPTVHYEISWFPIPYSFILLNFIRFFQKTMPWCGVNFLQNRFHIEHGFLSYAKVAFLKVIAKFILPFFCIAHELDILYINRRHHYNKKEKMELFFCIVFDLHYLCRRKSGTRQSESTFIALVCIIFAEEKAALGNLKTSFHCARLHYLCIRKIDKV